MAWNIDSSGRAAEDEAIAALRASGIFQVVSCAPLPEEPPLATPDFRATLADGSAIVIEVATLTNAGTARGDDLRTAVLHALEALVESDFPRIERRQHAA